MKRSSGAIILSLIMVLVIATSALAAYALTITVNETSGNTYQELPIGTYADVTAQKAAGFITATGLDTRVKDGSVVLPHMLATDRILFTSDIAPFSTTVFNYTAGNAPLTSFPTIVGNGGYITTADHADLEFGSGFDITITGYFDTSAALINENILYKQDSIRVYVQAESVIRAAILSAGDVEERVVDGAVVTGAHALRIYISGATFCLGLDGSRIAHTHLSQDVVAGDTLSTQTATVYLEYTALHKSFYAKGRSWVFWGKDSTVQYCSSADGTSWTAPSTVLTGITWANDRSDWITDGTYVYMAYYDTGGDKCYFRKGTLNTDGSITWLAGASQISTDSARSPVLALDTNGDVYCAYHYDADDFIYLDKLVAGSATWSSVAGFPKKTGLGADGHITGQLYAYITPMASGRIYISSAENGTALQKHGQLWTGSAFAAYDHISWFFIDRIESYGDKLYGLGISGSSSKVWIYTYGAGWDGGTSLSYPASGGSSDDHSICVDQSTGDVYVVRYVLTDDKVFYKRFDADSSTWDANWTEISDESVDKIHDAGIDTFQYAGGGRVSCSYWTREGGAGNYKIKCAFILLNDTPVPNTANDYVLMAGNTVPYASGIDFTINGTQTLLYAPVTIVNDAGVDGTVDAGSDTTLDDATLTQADDYWNGARLVINTTTDGLAPKGETAVVTDFDSANDRLIFAALTVALEAGDTYSVDYGTLPDRAGTAQNGRITWGSGPGGISTPAAIPPPATTEVTDPGLADGTALVSSAPTAPGHMYTEGHTGGLFGLGDLLDPALGATGTPVEVFWYPIAFLLALVLGFGAYKVTRSLLMQSIVSGVVMAAFAGGGVLGDGLLPFWTVLVFLIEAILVWLIQEKQNI